MKKLILMLCMFTCISYAQPNYTVYDCTTLLATYASYELPTDVGACYTTAIVTENWFRPTYNPTCNCFFNNATPAEQMNYLMMQEINAIPYEQLQSTNNYLTTPQTSATLNVIYWDRPVNFSVCTPHIGTGMIYQKISQTEWCANAVSKI